MIQHADRDVVKMLQEIAHEVEVSLDKLDVDFNCSDCGYPLCESELIVAYDVRQRQDIALFQGKLYPKEWKELRRCASCGRFFYCECSNF